MRNKWMAVMMCLCICLSMCGCGNNESAEEETTITSERAAVVNNGTLAEDSTAIAVGKTAVTYAEYKIYDYFMRNPYESVLGADVWNYKTGSGKSIGQEAVEDVLRLIIQVKVINKAAEQQKIVLAADEKEEADNAAVKFCETMDEKTKAEHSISTSLVSRIFEENKLAEKMYNIVTGKVGVVFSDEQCEAARVHLIYLKADDSNRDNVRSEAVKLQNQAKNANHFFALAKEVTQADQVEYLIGRQDSRAKLAKAVLEMEQGTVSGVIEETDGFYIAYCVEGDSKSVRSEYRNQVVQEKQNEAFAAEYKNWADSYEVKVSRSLLVE